MDHKYIRVQGREFKKGQTPMVFRGIGIGSWLNLEHFMTGLPTPDNQIRSAVEKVFGREDGELFFDSYIRNFITEKDFLFLKECGINIIRVPFNYRLFIDDNEPGRLKENGFLYFDRLMDLCDRYQVYLLPDLHTVPGGQNPDWHSDNDTGIPQFWFYKVFRDQMVWLWQQIAQRYAEREYLLGYDILNEPFLMDAPDVLWEFYADVTQAIRRVDRNHILFLEGDHFAMKFECIQKIEDENTALSFHFYPTVWIPALLDRDYGRDKRKEKFEEILIKILSVRERLQRPVLCGEAGYDIDKERIGDTLELVSDTLELFEKHKVSWTLWSYKDAQFMGICYPHDKTPWMDLVNRIHEKWTHYGEMKQARQIMEYIKSFHGFEKASEELEYFMQFRQRGILYRFQAECILEPVLREYGKKRFLELPDSFLFENCGYHEEYRELLRKITPVS